LFAYLCALEQRTLGVVIDDVLIIDLVYDGQVSLVPDVLKGTTTPMPCCLRLSEK
jgi:hypothetical protein